MSHTGGVSCGIDSAPAPLHLAQIQNHCGTSVAKYSPL